ncbi:MAG: glycoside hydrolase family 127 protein [Catenulispora sp.]|nr:glycoside hydrolase family 127 protein [Catenulispora sp.]
MNQAHVAPTDPRRGPVHPTARSDGALRPATRATITTGFWATRRTINAEVCIPRTATLLESAGNLHNFRLAAGQTPGEYRGDLPFLDSDVYKWLEAAAWSETTTAVRDTIALIHAAQRDDGYLNTWFQVAKDGERWTDLRWGHELYCAGHLIQAAVALHRTTGDTELLTIATRFADCIDNVFGPDKKIDGVCGHAQIETALVELYRETNEQRYLNLASYFIDRRGHGLLNPATTPGPAYCQDHIPVREAKAVAGHAVRQLYFLAGVTDVAAETNDPSLRSAAERLWTEMTARKTHITGGLGAHHAEEDFGDPYELPNERAYCETCAAIASVQWNWRMTLLTGEAKYSDLTERTLYNAVLPGISLDGTRWLYANPLQVRDEHVDRHGDHGVSRAAWFRCACCPPNAMRLLASLPHYFASTDADGVQLHQYATGSYDAVHVETNYPWHGQITVTIERAGPWTLSLRIPAWCTDHSTTVNDIPTTATPTDGWLRLHSDWRPGDVVSLNLTMPIRLTTADPRVDAIRGCAAIERGPLVYCLEEGDQPIPGLDAFVLDTTTTLTTTTITEPTDPLNGVTVIHGTSHRRIPTSPGWWPYTITRSDTLTAPLPFLAIPYYTWANRKDGAMRIWLPMT